MKTAHYLFIQDANDMSALDDQSIDLVVTSPPYPMIQMWDELFAESNPKVANALKNSDGKLAFELMHQCLDGTWKELHRVVKPGGYACINIGDATRTINSHFQLFTNHARVVACFQSLGFCMLPSIVWRKPNNSPNKFMGSGMLPPGAYVTHEHEYILIFRKGGKRAFTNDLQKQNRQLSAYFWEERNIWFSDIWFDLKGVAQKLPRQYGRERSAAFPFELPYRLINMFSVKQDTVLDPFLGTGTTMLAAMCAGRNCVGFERDAQLESFILQNINAAPDLSKHVALQRLTAHRDFVIERMKVKRDLKYINKYYGFWVMTRQEIDLRLDLAQHLFYQSNNRFEIELNSSDSIQTHEINSPSAIPCENQTEGYPSKCRQLKMF